MRHCNLDAHKLNHLVLAVSVANTQTRKGTLCISFFFVCVCDGGSFAKRKRKGGDVQKPSLIKLDLVKNYNNQSAPKVKAERDAASRVSVDMDKSLQPTKLSKQNRNKRKSSHQLHITNNNHEKNKPEPPETTKCLKKRFYGFKARVGPQPIVLGKVGRHVNFLLLEIHVV